MKKYLTVDKLISSHTKQSILLPNPSVSFEWKLTLFQSVKHSLRKHVEIYHISLKWPWKVWNMPATDIEYFLSHFDTPWILNQWPEPLFTQTEERTGPVFDRGFPAVFSIGGGPCCLKQRPHPLAWQKMMRLS